MSCISITSCWIFKFLESSTGKLTDLYYDGIPAWEHNGVFILGTLEEKSILPTEISLSAYPNPFNPSTTISFQIPKDGVIQLSIYNLAGQKVTELAHSYETTGIYKTTWNATDYSSGVYFAHLEMNDISQWNL